MPASNQPGGVGARDDAAGGPRATFDRAVANLKKRLVGEGTIAVAMLEAAIEALWKLDVAKAREVRKSDDRVDREEVEIEQECYRLMTLQHPFARDFRVLTFVLKVNGDLERVADHATSIAKVAQRLDFTRPPEWPTSLVEMGQRVTVMCHSLLRAVLDEDAMVAAQIVGEDKTIDVLERRLFEEIEDLMRKDPTWVRNGLLIYRVGRELERVGDLMKNIAEDVIYLATGSIVRHEKRALQGAFPGATGALPGSQSGSQPGSQPGGPQASQPGIQPGPASDPAADSWS